MHSQIQIPGVTLRLELSIPLLVSMVDHPDYYLKEIANSFKNLLERLNLSPEDVICTTREDQLNSITTAICYGVKKIQEKSGQQ